MQATKNGSFLVTLLLLSACGSQPALQPAATRPASAQTQISGTVQVNQPLKTAATFVPAPPVLTQAPGPVGQVTRQGNGVKIQIQLPPLPGFRTQALDLTSAATLLASISDSSGHTYIPEGADANGKVAYPANGLLELNFANVYPDELLIAELSVADTNGNIPQATLATAFQASGIDPVSADISFRTTPTALAAKAVLAADVDTGRTLNLSALQVFVDLITGAVGTGAATSYTTHPSLVNVAKLGTDLNAQSLANLQSTPASGLDETDYRLPGATAHIEVAGLVESDRVRLQLTDAASSLVTSSGNTTTLNLLKATPGTGIKLLASSVATPGTSYTYSISANPVTLTNNLTTNLTVTAVPATPTLTSISPATVKTGDTLTLTGTHFHRVEAGNVVTIGGQSATVSSVNGTGTSMDVIVPSGLVNGSRAVQINVGTAVSNILNVNLSNGPVLTGLSPTSGSIGGTVALSISGLNATLGLNTVRFGETELTPSAISGGLSVTLPAGLWGKLPVTVKNDDSPLSNALDFTVVPTIANTTPTSGTVGSALVVAGTGFAPTADDNSLSINDSAATISLVDTAGLHTTVPTGLYGTVPITVTTTGSTASSTYNFAITPVLDAPAPDSGSSGDVLNLTGSGFHLTANSNTVTLSTTALTPTVTSSTNMSIALPNLSAGVYTLSVTVGAQTSNTLSITLNPKISAVGPAALVDDKAPLIGGATITISGTNFDLDMAANNTISFGGIEVAASGFSDGDLEVVVPRNLETGDLDLTVNTNGMISAAFAANVPVISVGLNGGFY